MVTSNWNKNDDVFGKSEVWAARHTPSHKPTNIEHDEKQLVGHITDCWAIDTEHKILSDNLSIDELPDVFHLVNGAVIYKSWSDDGLNTRTSNLIAEIEQGKKFVSMECLFTDFGYAIITPEGQHHIVARAKDTAWMTKHLRAYGGSGEYDGNKIGRYLKNITFSGKGYVDKPANPNSVILSAANTLNFSTASQENPFFSENGVFITTEASGDAENTLRGDTNMSEALQKQNDEFKAEIAILKAEIDKVNKANYEGKITDLTAEIDAANALHQEDGTKIDELDKKIKTHSDELGELKTANEKLESQLNEVKAAELKANRISTLVDGGIEKEAAEKKVDIFADLTNEQFDAVSSEMINAVKSTKSNDEEIKDKKTDVEAKADEETDKSDENADEDVLKNAEADKSDTNLTVENEDEDKIEGQKASEALEQIVMASFSLNPNEKGDK